MAKEDEEVAGYIKLNEYQEELEKEVAFHTARVLALGVPRVNKKYTHIEIPDFGDDLRAKKDWELEEIRRCIHGHDGLVGRYYHFFNHVRIKHKSRGRIRPDFRTIQLEWAKTKERVYRTVGLGLVMIKRRQIGLSWDIAADNVYDCTFNNDFDIGMNSKGEADSRNLFKKVKEVHRYLPDFLKPVAQSVDRRDAMEFSKIVKDKYGNKTKIGTQSSIISVAPTPTSHAGNQYKKLVIDEAGEQLDLMALWSNAEDCIMQETLRVGTPIIFGTMGETDKAGSGLKEFWMNHKLYNLEQFAIWGYNGLLMDDFGNDKIEDSIRWIIYTRKKKESGSRVVYNKFLQKYPLHERDAFLQVGNYGVGDPIKIGNRILELEKNPPECVTGFMRRDAGGVPIFVPDTINGKITVYERPDHNRKNGYRIVLDPAEDDDVVKKSGNDVSDLATCVGAKPFGMEPSKIVAEYTDRPLKLEDYYSQLSMLAEWYNNTQIDIETNKGGWRAIDWFRINFPKLLGLSPASATSAKGGVEMRVGVKKTTERTQQMMGLIDGYVDNYVDFIPSLKLLKQFGVFGALHEDDDLAVAFGWFLVIMQADRTVAKYIDKELQKLPTIQYQKIKGVLQMVDKNQVISKPQQRTNSVLFRR
jgi:hypothetical protein